MKKRTLTSALAVLAIQPLAWGQTTLRDAFANAPDEVFPLLTRNNRLDCLDFAEGKVNMEVKNRGDGQTRIDSMTNDYLRISMTAKSRVELRMLPATDQQPQRICMIRTYMGPAEDSQVSLYDTYWQLLGTVERPLPDAFMDEALDHEVRGILTDLSLMCAAFAEDGKSLVWNMPTTELNKEQKSKAEGHMHNVTIPITLKPSAE